MPNNLHSNWSVPELLAGLRHFRRADDGSDLLAFRVVGDFPHRAVFVYLYGKDPDLIHFDLEDESRETRNWDHAVRRGSVRSLEELRSVVASWLPRCGMVS